MKILVTGAKGFVGKNLVASLESIRDKKDRVHVIKDLLDPGELEIVGFDVDTPEAVLEEACIDCDFVFNLAGINRPKEKSEFDQGNHQFVDKLLGLLKKNKNTCPVMLSSSVQATLSGRFGDSEYGRSKLAGEQLYFDYGRETGARVYVYRFPNLFGKWCKPNYNSAVATFCNNIANDLPIQVNDPTVELELVYIDDLVAEMIRCINGEPSRCDFKETTAVPDANGVYCFCPVIHKVTLGEIADLLHEFRRDDDEMIMPSIPDGSFAKKLYSTYLSYFPASRVASVMNMNIDNRGNFTELMHTKSCGQVSINIANPGIGRGMHWHHSKWEIFAVVAGEGLIRQRKIGTDEVIESRVSGQRITAVRILPGYTHSIINLSETDNLVTVMWANEPFDPNKPDTYFEEV